MVHVNKFFFYSFYCVPDSLLLIPCSYTVDDGNTIYRSELVSRGCSTATYVKKTCIKNIVSPQEVKFDKCPPMMYFE